MQKEYTDIHGENVQLTKFFNFVFADVINYKGKSKTDKDAKIHRWKRIEVEKISKEIVINLYF